MAHPYRSAARGTTKGKFSSMLGSPKGAKHMDNDSVVNPNTSVRSGIEDVKIMGHPAPKRLDRARGGKVDKKVTVNVFIPPSGGDLGAKPPLPPLPMPPPGAGAMPPMPGKPGPGAAPPMIPQRPTPVMPQPGAGFPLPKARGGSVKRQEGGAVPTSYLKDKKGGWDARTMAVTSAKGLTHPGFGYTAHRATQDLAAGRVTNVPKTSQHDAKDQSRLEKSRGGYIGGEPNGNKLKQWAQYARKNSYHKKTGGGVSDYPISGGADSGVGRAQLNKAYKKSK